MFANKLVKASEYSLYIYFLSLFFFKANNAGNTPTLFSYEIMILYSLSIFVSANIEYYLLCFSF